MLDIIIIVAASIHLGQKAERKGHPGQTGIAAGTILIAEIGGVILGYVIGGILVALLLGLLGLAIGVLIAHSRVSALPDISARDMQAPTYGPSRGDQVVGEECPRCHKPFLMLLEVERCPECDKAYHSKCLPAHRKSKHAKAHRKEAVENAS